MKVIETAVMPDGVLCLHLGVEFYVIAAVVAAAVLAFAARGEQKGPVRQYLLAGVLSHECVRDQPSVEAICNEDGSVVLRRHGLRDINDNDAVSLAVNVKGFDVEIKERRATGHRTGGETVDTASFILDFMACERYFISYRSDEDGLFCSFALHNRSGIRTEKRLQ